VAQGQDRTDLLGAFRPHHRQRLKRLAVPKTGLPLGCLIPIEKTGRTEQVLELDGHLRTGGLCTGISHLIA